MDVRICKSLLVRISSLLDSVMYTLVEKGEDWRIFKDKILGIIPLYVFEDCREASYKGGVWMGVKFTNYYFKSLNQVKNKENV